MNWNCICGGIFKYFNAEPDVGIIDGANVCSDCGKIPDDEDHMNNSAVDPNEYVPDIERI